MGPLYDQPRETLTAEQVDASLRYQIMDVVDQIRWIPDFGYERELDWLRNMHDWMISKKRYWGLALPIYDCAACGTVEVIGGREELKDRAVEGWETFEGHTPHRPRRSQGVRSYRAADSDAIDLNCCGGGFDWIDRPLAGRCIPDFLLRRSAARRLRFVLPAHRKWQPHVREHSSLPRAAALQNQWCDR